MNPYPGLRPFLETDSALFFGREEETDCLLDRLAARRLVAVLGVSGVGKSSLVMAGLIPVLRSGLVNPLSGNWEIYVLNPGREPLVSLDKALGDFLEPQTHALLEWAKHRERKKRILIVVDQFEEIFAYRKATIEIDRGNAAALFIDLLLTAAQEPELPLYIVLTMRTDYLGECAVFRGLAEALNDGHYLVPRLSRLQQQDAIIRPAEMFGVRVQHALVQRLLVDAEDDPDKLPVLQHLLKVLWENRADAQLDLELYEKVGGWKHALEKDAEGALAQFEHDLDGVRKLFQWLTGPGTGDKPVRLRQQVGDLPAVTNLDNVQIKEIIDAYTRRGFLLHGDKQNGTVQLMHESIIWHWQRLKTWIEEETSSVSVLRFCNEAARKHLVLTGTALAEAKQFQKRLETSPKWAMRYLPTVELKNTLDWIVESEAREQKAMRVRRKRELRPWIHGFLTLFLICALGTAWYSHRRELAAISQAMAANAGLSLNEDRAKSLDLAIRGWRTWKTEEAHLAIASTFLQALTTVQAHTSRVSSAGYSPDGKYLVTASWDGTAGVWRSSNGELVATLQGHTGKLTSAQFSPEGDRILTTSEDKTARIWSMREKQSVVILRGHTDTIWRAAFSRDGQLVATASGDHTAKIWNTTSGEVLHTLQDHKGPLRSVSFSPDRKLVASASDDKTTIIWNTATGEKQHILGGHSEAVLHAVFAPNGNRVLTASADKTARLWDAESGQLLMILAGHVGKVLDAEFSPDGHQIVTGSEDSTSGIWDSASGKLLARLQGHAGPIVQVDFSQDGRWIVTASLDKTARIWDSRNGQLLAVLQGHGNSVRSARFSPTAERVLTASDDNTAKEWGTVSSVLMFSLQGDPEAGRDAEFSPNNKYIVTSGQVCMLWNAETGQLARPLEGHSRRVISVVFSPDGQRVITASWDKTAQLWEIPSGRLLTTLKGHINGLTYAGFSPDGARIITTGDNTGRVWSASTGQLLFALAGHTERIVHAQFSPTGRSIVTSSLDHTARVWDSSTGRLLAILNTHAGPVRQASFSSDGKQIVTASADHVARVWKTTNGELSAILRGHTDEVVSAEFSPDSRYIVTASSDRTARVWDAVNGQMLTELRGHQEPVWQAHFSPDSKSIVTASSDHTAKVWDAVSGNLSITLQGHTTIVESVHFSSDGQHIITTSGDHTARVYRKITLEEVADLLAK